VSNAQQDAISYVLKKKATEHEKLTQKPVAIHGLTWAALFFNDLGPG
jgi:hypothetical protein